MELKTALNAFLKHFALIQHLQKYITFETRLYVFTYLYIAHFEVVKVLQTLKIFLKYRLTTTSRTNFKIYFLLFQCLIFFYPTIQNVQIKTLW